MMIKRLINKINQLPQEVAAIFIVFLGCIGMLLLIFYMTCSIYDKQLEQIEIVKMFLTTKSQPQISIAL